MNISNYRRLTMGLWNLTPKCGREFKQNSQLAKKKKKKKLSFWKYGHLLTKHPGRVKVSPKLMVEQTILLTYLLPCQLGTISCRCWESKTDSLPFASATLATPTYQVPQRKLPFSKALHSQISLKAMNYRDIRKPLHPEISHEKQTLSAFPYKT